MDHSGAPPLLQLKDVSKVFSTEKLETHALAHINVTVHKGEFVCIAGPSGCGKSTLLSILGLLDQPTHGSYLINGVPMEEQSHTTLARVRNREIGFVFQDFNLIGDLTVYENVELPLTHRTLNKRERRERVTECLRLVGIAERMDHFPAQLSGGQQQRVAVARAVVGRPSLLLADEPTGNLDSVNGDAVMELILGLNQRQGVTVCMVTHDSRYAHAGSRTIQLFDGKIANPVTEASAPHADIKAEVS